MVELARYRREKGLAPFPITGETTPLLLPIGRQTRALTRAAVHSIVKQVFKDAADRIRARGIDFESKARQIGRASGRERVCKYVKLSWVAVQFKKKKNKKTRYQRIQTQELDQT